MCGGIAEHDQQQRLAIYLQSNKVCKRETCTASREIQIKCEKVSSRVPMKQISVVRQFQEDCIRLRQQ